MGSIILIDAYLRFRHSASRYVRLAHLYSAVGVALLRSCYGQILGPRRQFPQLADRLWRGPNVCLQLHSHLIWQATECDVERRDAFGLVPHEYSLLLTAKCEEPTTSSPSRRALGKTRASSSRCQQDVNS